MNTILTDDERPKLPEPELHDGVTLSKSGKYAGTTDGYTAEQIEAYADAREAAVLAKLREQEPPYLRQLLMEVVCLTYRPDLQVQASELLAAPLPAVVQVPPGYKLVPVEPTPEMLKAAKDSTWIGGHYSSMAYRAMLAAAPEAPAQEKSNG